MFGVAYHTTITHIVLNTFSVVFSTYFQKNVKCLNIKKSFNLRIFDLAVWIHFNIKEEVPNINFSISFYLS